MKVKRRALLLLAIVSIVIVVAYELQEGREYPTKIVCEGDLISITSQLEYYKRDHGSYPTTNQGLAALVKRPVELPATANWFQRLRSVPLDPWKQPYQYLSPGERNHEGFDLYSLGLDGVKSSDDIFASRYRSDN